jgi:dolichyl-phosphate beta-glucosyltransferase
MHLSVIVPIYNGADTVGHSVNTILRHYRERDPEFELIVVDDCSTDDTEVKLKDLQVLNPELRVVRNLKNQGKGYSIRQGFLQCTGDVILFTDADLPYGTDGLDAVCDALNRDADVAIGSRVHPNSQYTMHPRHFPYIFFRHLLGRILVAFANRLFQVQVSDTQCGIKGFRKIVGATILPNVNSRRFAFDIEFLSLARHFKWTIEEVPVNLSYTGQTTTVKIMRDSYVVLRDLLKIKFANIYSDREAKLLHGKEVNL